MTGEKSKKKAIAYYRHSAEDKQENSVPIQREHARVFAEKHNIEIIHEEADEGKTGLLADRPGFTRIFQNWIFNTQAAPFDYVLVYDVSRWGRFQDQDEAAYYEFLCKKQGKKVVYVSRGFPKEEQELISHLQTSIERYMAAEYSRQLSNKVFHGCVQVSREGYSAGGTPCYGMARLLLDVNKRPIRVLKKGEHKQIANERVTFVPRNDDTTTAVQEIYRLFVEKEKSILEIMHLLNKRNIPSANGGSWNREKILRILTNEVYTGARIYNKTWNRLRQGKRNNPRSDWVICPRAFPAVINKEQFKKAQERLYWSSLASWRDGINAIRRAQPLIQSGLESSLVSHSFTEDEAIQLTQQFPLIFSVALNITDTDLQWCFVLPEGMRGFEFVIGVSVVPTKTNVVDQFFIIPTRDFGFGGVAIFSTKNKSYVWYKADQKQLESSIVSIANELRSSVK